MLKINFTLNKIILPWQQIHALGLIAVYMGLPTYIKTKVIFFKKVFTVPANKEFDATGDTNNSFLS